MDGTSLPDLLKSTAKASAIGSPDPQSPKHLSHLVDDRHQSLIAEMRPPTPRTPRGGRRQPVRAELSQTDVLVVLGIAETEAEAEAKLEKDIGRERRRLEAARIKAVKERANLEHLEKRAVEKEHKKQLALEELAAAKMRKGAEHSASLRDKQQERFNRSQTIVMSRELEKEQKKEEHGKK